MQALQVQTAPCSSSNAVRNSRFMLLSTKFGYSIYAAHVKGRPDVEITDQPNEAAVFEYGVNDGEKMAKVMSKRYGYPFAVVPVLA